MFVAGVPFVNASRGRTHTGGELTMERSVRSEGQPDKYRPTPVTVELEDGGVAVTAAI